MSKVTEEKRWYPRVKAKLDVGISKNTLARVCNLSERGVQVRIQKTNINSKEPLQIYFPNFNLKTKAKLAWKKSNNSKNLLSGMEFMNLTDYQRILLRKKVIEIRIEKLLTDIKDSGFEKKVSDFFLKYLLNYISELTKAASGFFREKKYSKELEKKLRHINNQFLLKANSLEKLLSNEKAATQKIKDIFRELTGVWIYKSFIMKHGFEKPKGYPGDYEIIEIGYNNKPISKNFGRYLDNYFLKTPYAVAIRLRKDRLRDMVKEFVSKSKVSKINILNIACGSCREIRELLTDINKDSSIIFNCLDWDQDALNFSKNNLLPIKPNNIEFYFIREDVMNLIKNKSTVIPQDKQNLIYSIGLIDYLPDRALKKLILALYNLLPRGGKMILTHKNKEKTFPPIPPNWFCDWKFIPRSKDEVIKLFHGCRISDFSLLTEVDDFGYIYYFTLTKNQQ